MFELDMVRSNDHKGNQNEVYLLINEDMNRRVVGFRQRASSVNKPSVPENIFLLILAVGNVGPEACHGRSRDSELSVAGVEDKTRVVRRHSAQLQALMRSCPRQTSDRAGRRCLRTQLRLPPSRRTPRRRACFVAIASLVLYRAARPEHVMIGPTPTLTARWER